MSGPLVSRLDPMGPGLERERDRVIALVAEEDMGAPKLPGPTLSEDRAAFRWTAARAAKGVVSLPYFMPADLPHPLKRGPQMDLRMVDRGTSSASGGVLLAPEGRTHLPVRWHPVPGQ